MVTSTTVSLDSSVRLVVLQFSFSNSNVIPVSVKRLSRETIEEQNVRKNRSTGTLVIEPTENCSLVEFLNEIDTAGYEMVDAFYKKRIDPNGLRRHKTYHMVRFLFVRCEYLDLSEEFRAVRDTIKKELRSMCESAMWRVRVFLNPFFEDGEEVIGQHAVSINLESRSPLFSPDGQPVMVWQRDGGGNRLGNAPLPLRPNYYLRIKNNTIYLAED